MNRFLIASLFVLLGFTVGWTDSDIPLTKFPSSPAFVALGVTPTNVLMPTTPRELGADLASGVSSSGDLIPGIAIEAAPLWIAYGDRITLKDWRKKYWKRAPSRLTLSLATSSIGTTDTTAIAQGLKFVLWDFSDLRFDEKLEECISRALTPVTAESPSHLADIPGFVATDNALIKTCKEQALNRMPNSNASAIAIALTESKSSGKADFDRFLAWYSVTFSPPLTESTGFQEALVLGYIRDIQGKTNAMTVSSRTRLGNQHTGVAADFTWAPRVANSQIKSKSFITAVIGELRLAESTWAELEVGGHLGKDAPKDIFSTLKLKFGLSEVSKLSP